VSQVGAIETAGQIELDLAQKFSFDIQKIKVRFFRTLSHAVVLEGFRHGTSIVATDCQLGGLTAVDAESNKLDGRRWNCVDNTCDKLGLAVYHTERPLLCCTARVQLRQLTPVIIRNKPVYCGLA